MDDNFPKIIFTGGGSGGHLSIIKALTDYLKEKGVNVGKKVLVVGGKLGMIDDPGISIDERRIPEFGVPYRFIRGGKLHRALKKKTFLLLWGFIPGLFDSYKVIKEFGPEIVFATGGYVSLPMIMVGRILGKKIIIHEQTLKAGLSNKIGGLFAHKILVSFEESCKYFPKSKVEVSGNVLRREVYDLSRNIIPEKLQEFVDNAILAKKPILYVTGGSLGAHRINLFIGENLDKIVKKYSLIWQTGENELYSDYDKYVSKIQNLNLEEKVYITKYVKEEIGFVLKNADIVIARPGANTLYELACLGKKAILIPLWVTSKSDQQYNAEWYIENFVGDIMEDRDLQLDEFFRKVDILLIQNWSRDGTLNQPDFFGVEEKIINIITEGNTELIK